MNETYFLQITLLQVVLSETESKIKGSHPRRSMKKGVVEHFAKSTGKHLCQSLFFNKDAGLGM